MIDKNSLYFAFISALSKSSSGKVSSQSNIVSLSLPLKLNTSGKLYNGTYLFYVITVNDYCSTPNEQFFSFIGDNKLHF